MDNFLKENPPHFSVFQVAILIQVTFYLGK